LKILVPNKQSYAIEYVPNNKDDNYAFIDVFFQFPSLIHRLVGCLIDPFPYPAFSREQDYNEGDIVYTNIQVGNLVTKKLYKALADITHDPNNDGCTNCTPAPWECPTCWEEIESSTILDCFDKYINTKYNGICDKSFEFETIWSSTETDAAALLGCEANSANITWENDETSQTLTYNLNIHKSKNFYEYFFRGWSKKDFVISFKPFVNITKVTVELSPFKVGTILLGKIYDVGITQYGYEKRSRDFSKITTTSTGLEYIQKGNNTKKYIINFLVHNDLASDVFDLLQGLSSTLCLYVLEDGEWVFGYYKDHYMVKKNPVFSEYHLEINGVI